MANEHLGTICNAHVVHADISEYGAMDENCLLLAELAATAVDFPKTGKIVTMPFHLKPKLYPDFMGKEEYQTYKSNKIMGRLYRRVKEVYDEDAEASSEESSEPSDIPYDTDLEIPGFEDFIPGAWGHKCSYDGQFIGLLGQYKVQKEEEIVTGHIWSMAKYASKKQGELKERLKHSYNSLKKEFRKVFEETMDHENLSEEDENILYEKKALFSGSQTGIHIGDGRSFSSNIDVCSHAPEDLIGVQSSLHGSSIEPVNFDALLASGQVKPLPKNPDSDYRIVSSKGCRSPRSSTPIPSKIDSSISVVKDIEGSGVYSLYQMPCNLVADSKKGVSENSVKNAVKDLSCDEHRFWNHNIASSEGLSDPAIFSMGSDKPWRVYHRRKKERMKA